MESTARADARADVDAYHVRARALVAHAVRRRWQEGLLARGGRGPLGGKEIENLLDTPFVDENKRERIVDFEYPRGTPVGDFAAQLRLTPTQADLVAVLFATETSPVIARLVDYLAGSPGAFSFTLDLLFEVVYRLRDPSMTGAMALLHNDLAPHRPSRRFQFFVLDGADSRSLLSQGIRLHPRLIAWLLGQTGLPAELTPYCRYYEAPAPQADVDAAKLDDAVRALGEPGSMLLVEGPARSGRELLLATAAGRASRKLLVVSGRGMTHERMVASFREAVFQGSLLAFSDGAEALAGDLLGTFRECLGAWRQPIAIVGAGEMAPFIAELRPVAVVETAVPPFGERRRLWEANLGTQTSLGADQMQEVAALYNVGVAGITAASELAKRSASLAGRVPSRDDVTYAMRQLFHADLSTVAMRMEVSQTWDDLVLPEDCADSIVALLDRIRFRSDVLGRWGFARKVGKGFGVTALFSGSPGTGKSMVAGLIARELGLDLYVVDLARVTSKWLGETEKNLGRAFNAAEAGHVLLLFDEADTVLAKRSAVNSANDRNANLETNYILARLEQFQGVVFFTTNMASAIDPAIERRLSAHVRFPLPDERTRADLWRRMLPPEAPVEGPIDFEELARRFDLSGGYIRNIVLRAAYAAIREQSPITHAHLVRAAEAEYNERGALVGGRMQ